MSTIVVSGGWSAWGPYSACDPIFPPAVANMPCVGSKSRKRICDNPPPQNGGPQCPGSAIQYELCDCKGKPQLNYLTLFNFRPPLIFGPFNFRPL